MYSYTGKFLLFSFCLKINLKNETKIKLKNSTLNILRKMELKGVVGVGRRH